MLISQKIILRFSISMKLSNLVYRGKDYKSYIWRKKLNKSQYKYYYIHNPDIDIIIFVF